MITGYLGATSGEVKINGHDIFADLQEAKKCVGYLPEIPPLYTEMTVREYLDFVAELKGQVDHIDWLVSNAGVSTYAKYEDYTFEEWTRIVNTNLSVPVFMVKELRLLMSEGGSVLFTGSYAGQQAYSSSLVYGVTKAAIHFLTKSLVKEFEPKGMDLSKPHGTAPAPRKAMTALTKRSHSTGSELWKRWRIWRLQCCLTGI